MEKDEPESVKGTYRSITGRSINTLWGLQAERLFTEDDFINGELKPGIPKPELGTEVRPGDIKYVDMNDDGVITEADEGYIGGTKDPRMVPIILFRGADKAYWVMYTIIIPIAGQKRILRRMCSGLVYQRVRIPIITVLLPGGRKI